MIESIVHGGTGDPEGGHRGHGRLSASSPSVAKTGLILSHQRERGHGFRWLRRAYASLFGSGSTVDAGRRPAKRSTAANLMGSLSMGGVGTDVTATDASEDAGGLVERVLGWFASIKG